jgi:hypothetical protein
MERAPGRTWTTRAALASAIAIFCLAGCKDQAKESAKHATEDANTLADQVEKDVGDIERGLPLGAKALSSLYAKGADPKADIPAVRAALLKTVRDVPDLNIAKSTFFALSDDKGVGIRNNLEQDAMAGQDLMKLFPGIQKSVTDGTFVTTTGAFPGPPAPNGPDKDWIATMPVKGDDGAVKGLFVTGWSYRRFALHLQDSLKRELQDALKKSGDTGKLPVFYIGVFDASGVYTERQTPKVNEDAMVGLKLVEKTAAGPAQGTITITEREFGWAAKRTPKLGADTGVIVLRSEL